jgi:arylsulfatase A-like enzyme
VIVVVTDDQTAASMHGAPASMPWLQERLGEPGWTTFTNAVVTTPLCCPSRASILTGRYARHTGVSTNHDGANLDPGDTIAAALHDAGYRTALIGKYLNGYPWEGSPLVPPGWDRWFAKLNASDDTLYYGYDVVDDGDRRTIGHEEDGYATDLLADEAVAFVEDAPTDRPFFLYLSPSAPHGPAEPAPRHASLLEGEPPPVAPDALAAMNDVGDGPSWIRSAPPIDPTAAEALAIAELRERATLRAVDDAMRALWDAVAARGQLDRTVWLFLSDNGFSFGDRRWVGKTCPWETCVHVPFVIHVPGSDGGTSQALVANIDVVPTIAELAHVEVDDVDGRSVASLLDAGSPTRPDRRAVLLEWAGSAQVPPWVGVRLADAVLIHHDDGTRELYDLVSDPDQRRNLIGDEAASALRARAERALERALEGSASAG